MFDLCHPAYYKMSKLGSVDGTKITIAFYVYIELCEVKRLWDVEYKYNSDLDIIYIEGKKSKSSVPETYVPWPTAYKLSQAQIENIQKALKIDRFTFVFRGGDSTSVYYRVTKGLVKPISPEETKLIKQAEDKKFDLEQEIRKNTSILYELAKSINQGEAEIVGNENGETGNLTDEGEKLTNRMDEGKMDDADQEKTEVTKDQRTIEQTKNQVKIESIKSQERMQDSKTEENLVDIDTDVEMISESDVEILPSTSFR